jgi:hypothetical protein
VAHFWGVKGLLCACACVLVTVAPIQGRPNARTPADVERRRAEIVDRLMAIGLELSAVDDRLAGMPARLAAADNRDRPALADEGQTLEARRGVLLDERDRLLTEHAELALVRTRTLTGPLHPADPQGLSPFDLGGQQQDSTVTAGQAFNPAISVIPDIAYYNDDVAGEAFEIVDHADGFGGEQVDGDSSGHGHGALERGFNLREMEIAFSGAVDPYFDVWAVLALAPNEIEAEEVYVQTRKFVPGVQVRVGRFFSGVGHLNKQHPHQWDFVDQALPLQAIFGGTLVDTGLQATWLPDLPVYTLFGFEALQGTNERLSYSAADDWPDLFEETPGPRLFTGFLKVSPDVGFAHALQGGVSFGWSRSHQEVVAAPEGTQEALEGHTWFAGTDWVWRYDSPKPLGERDLTVQGEYLYRRKDLATLRAPDAVAGGVPVVYAQDGFYTQAVYGIAPRWTLAGRLDVLGLNNRVTRGGVVSEYEQSHRYTAAVTFNPTEFSRLRVQYDRGRARNDGTARTYQQVFVQFQMSLGVHGAHRF